MGRAFVDEASATAEAAILEAKRHAAIEAVSYIRDGMAVGLGTGSTAELMIAALGVRIAQERLRIRAIPTSEASALQARTLGIPLTDFAQDPVLDIAIDGADEVHRGTLDLIKGRGGALLREKIVAASARRYVVIVDDRKVVDQLGQRMPLPVEVTPWGWERAARCLAQLQNAQTCTIRRRANGEVFDTDNRNVIIDCKFSSIDDPTHLGREIRAITGVVDHGLFVGLTSQVIIAGIDGAIERLSR